MSNRSKVQKSVEWYSKNKPIFKSLADRVESIIREIIELNKIDYYIISSRAKTIESYEKKALMSRYKQPRKEIMDMAGIRVITYTDSDAKKVNELIQNTFVIYPEYSIDKTEELGTDKVGYRSIHCVGILGADRLRLPENMKFKNLCFEIQIRTILQHAWAEFEHDRNYKFSGVLPKKLKRRLSILAGTLELIDREFDNISLSIDEYTKDVVRKTEIGDLDESINSTSLNEYMTRKFASLIKIGVKPKLFDDEVTIDQINKMGIWTIQDLDKITPKDYIEKRKAWMDSEANSFTDIIIDILMIVDIDKYFKTAWEYRWDSTTKTDAGFFKEYDIDLFEYAEKYGFSIE